MPNKDLKKIVDAAINVIRSWRSGMIVGAYDSKMNLISDHSMMLHRDGFYKIKNKTDRWFVPLSECRRNLERTLNATISCDRAGVEALDYAGSCM